MDRIRAIKAKMKESLYIEQKDAADAGEYDYEGDMAKSQLRSILTHAKRLHDMIEDTTNLPEWVQSKITLAQDYVLTAADYMESEMNEEVDITESRSDDPDYDEALKRQKKGLPPIKRKSPYKKFRYIKNEEVEQVDERINMIKAKMGDVIKDFYKSKAPQFKGRSKTKRRQMAIAAKLSAERGGNPLER